MTKRRKKEEMLVSAAQRFFSTKAGGGKKYRGTDSALHEWEFGKSAPHGSIPSKPPRKRKRRAQSYPDVGTDERGRRRHA